MIFSFFTKPCMSRLIQEHLCKWLYQEIKIMQTDIVKWTNADSYFWMTIISVATKNSYHKSSQLLIKHQVIFNKIAYDWSCTQPGPLVKKKHQKLFTHCDIKELSKNTSHLFWRWSYCRSNGCGSFLYWENTLQQNTIACNLHKEWIWDIHAKNGYKLEAQSALGFLNWTIWGQPNEFLMVKKI